MSGWGFTNRPSITLGNAVFRGLIGGTGAKRAITDAIREGVFVRSTHGKDESYAESTRITVGEAAALQSYPPDFTFIGNKGSIGLQIGNAVPPLLAKAILEELWS